MSARQRRLLFSGALIGLLCVAFGAFGAHALRTILDEAARFRFDLGIRYAFIHCLAIIAAALSMPVVANPGRTFLAGLMFTLGTVLFSGSLLLLALTGARPFAMVTPVGGLVLIAGWGLFALSIGSNRNA